MECSRSGRALSPGRGTSQSDLHLSEKEHLICVSKALSCQRVDRNLRSGFGAWCAVPVSAGFMRGELVRANARS